MMNAFMSIGEGLGVRLNCSFRNSNKVSCASGKRILHAKWSKFNTFWPWKWRKMRRVSPTKVSIWRPALDKWMDAEQIVNCSIATAKTVADARASKSNSNDIPTLNWSKSISPSSSLINHPIALMGKCVRLNVRFKWNIVREFIDSAWFNNENKHISLSDDAKRIHIDRAVCARANWDLLIARLKFKSN